MSKIDDYFKDLMKKILDSYNVMKNLNDVESDLHILDVELSKINGLLKVLLRKSDEFSDKNPEFPKLQKKIKLYFNNHEFDLELSKIKEIYAKDQSRVKNIRNSIINSLEDGKLIHLIYEIVKNMK
tara:strand:- start:5077 stop:5454 length:378 start_codon:yes stop_codon:yes gene_type:complete